MVSLIFVNYGHVVKYQDLFLYSLFSDELQVINTGVLNMYEWYFLSYLHILGIWMSLIFIHYMESVMTLLKKIIGLVVLTFIGVPPSCERASVSVRWSWVTMCSRRRAEKRRALHQDDQLPPNFTESCWGFHRDQNSCEESSRVGNLLNDDDCEQFDVSRDTPIQ